MSDELQALVAAADAHDATAADAAPPGAPGAPGQAGPAAPAFGNYEACGMLLAMVREALCIALDVRTPRAVLADEKIEPLARAWGEVADHYGVSLANFTAGPLGLAVVQTLPVAMALYQGLKGELQAKRRTPQPEPPPETMAGE